MSDTSGTPLTGQALDRQAALVALNLAAPAAVVTALDDLLAPRARIVNVSSGAGLRALPFRGLYSATKAGLIDQSRALARERPELVVTVLCPGFVRTELVDSLIAAGRLDPRQAVAKTPLGRMAEPRELAEALLFLASPGAAVIRGQVLSLDGGSSVYGGSNASEPASSRPMPLDTPLAMTVTGDVTGAWSGLADQAGNRGYPAIVDVAALAGGDAMAAVHEAACRLAARHARDASLTCLLPADPATTRSWQSGGDAAAARMLVATIACELAPRALRVNAVEMAPTTTTAPVVPVLRYMAGARAQFLTGQTLRIT